MSYLLELPTTEFQPTSNRSLCYGVQRLDEGHELPKLCVSEFTLQFIATLADDVTILEPKVPTTGDGVYMVNTEVLKGYINPTIGAVLNCIHLQFQPCPHLISLLFTALRDVSGGVA